MAAEVTLQSLSSKYFIAEIIAVFFLGIREMNFTDIFNEGFTLKMLCLRVSFSVVQR